MQPLNRKTAQLDSPYPVKILQFGGGNFLRAFCNWMVDILNQEAQFRGSVIIVKPTKRGDYASLRQQDGLFHVSLNGLKAGHSITQNRLIQCVRTIIHPYLDWSAYLATAEIPTIRYIISNTTESGIVFNDEDRFGDAPPREFPAKLTVWLYHRYQCFLGDESKGCVFLPCELIEQNGDALRQSILQYAEAWELGWDFQKWITHYNYFCNTLVDRIVAGYPKDKADEIQESIGFQDKLLVAGEYYHSWVIQAPDFLETEIPFAKTDLNVHFVKDLKPYREMKVRLLNGAHTSMVPIGYLMGISTVGEFMKHPKTYPFIIEELKQEIAPTLLASAQETHPFIADTVERFQNPHIKHQLLSIALNSISKFKTRLLPSLLRFQQQHQKLPQRIVFALAALIHFYRGTWQGKVIPLKDDPAVISFFQSAWQSAAGAPLELAAIVLANEELWGQDIRQIDGLQEVLANYISKIEVSGIEPIIEELMHSTVSS